MSTTVERLFEQAMSLPGLSRAALAERLVESLGTGMDPDVEQAHLEVAKRRRDEVRSGKVKPIPGEIALARVRHALRR